MTVHNGKTIVMDQGTGSLKIGYAGEETPHCIIPSLVGSTTTNSSRTNAIGKPINQYSNIKSIDQETCIVGSNALKQRENLSLSYPMKSGVVHDWDAMEKLWGHSFQTILELSTEDAKESKILITTSSLNPTLNRNQMVEHLFETQNIGAVNLSNQAVLVLYAQGLLTGIVVDCGEGVTQVVPIYEGIVPHHLMKRHAVNGNKITTYLAKLLQLRGYGHKLASDLETVREIKEDLCYTSCDLSMDRRLARETTALVETYELPDGTTIKVGQERFEASEAYFDPSLIDMECTGLSDLVFDTIQECDISCRLQYYEHIILSGGSSMFPGMSNRLQNDIRQRYLKDILKGDETRVKKYGIHVEAPTNRENSVFIGGSILANLMQDQEDFWITKADYEEIGIERALESCKL